MVELVDSHRNVAGSPAGMAGPELNGQPAAAISPAAAPSIPLTTAPSTAAQNPGAARRRLLLEGPIVSTLLRLAVPNVVVNVVLIAVTVSVDAHFVDQLDPSALAGLSLV